MLWDVITIKLQDHWEPTHCNLGVTRVVWEPYSKGKKTFHDLLIHSSHSTVDADYLGWSVTANSPFYVGLSASMDYTCWGYCGWLPAMWNPRDIQDGSMYFIYLLLWVLLSVTDTEASLGWSAWAQWGWTSQCPESPRWLYLRLPLMTCSSATFLLRGSSGPWLVSCIPMGTASSTLAVQERSLDEQNFLYFLRFLLKVAVPHHLTWTGIGVLSQMFPWLTLWFPGTFIICN